MNGRTQILYVRGFVRYVVQLVSMWTGSGPTSPWLRKTSSPYPVPYWYHSVILLLGARGVPGGLGLVDMFPACDVERMEGDERMVYVYIVVFKRLRCGLLYAVNHLVFELVS